MKLVEAITYATNHDKFVDFLQDLKIGKDSAHEIQIRITRETPKTIEHRIYFDFGNLGESAKDVRVIVDFDKATRNFHFIQIDQRSR